MELQNSTGSNTMFLCHMINSNLCFHHVILHVTGAPKFIAYEPDANMCVLKMHRTIKYDFFYGSSYLRTRHWLIGQLIGLLLYKRRRKFWKRLSMDVNAWLEMSWILLICRCVWFPYWVQLEKSCLLLIYYSLMYIFLIIFSQPFAAGEQSDSR